MDSRALLGKAAVVTGARRGIGRAVALAFAGAGADIVAADAVWDDGGLCGTEESARGFGVRAVAVRADISRPGEVRDLARRAEAAFGHVDILANCAGVWMPGRTLVECSDGDWDAVIGTNLKGTFLCCREIGRGMIARRSGVIVNIASQVGLTPGAGTGAYSVSKAGIIMLTRQLALEAAPYGVRVNALAPGIVKTDFNAEFWNTPDREREAAGEVPLGHLAEAGDVAGAALFLASDAAGYITGEVLAVGGGWAPSRAVRIR